MVRLSPRLKNKGMVPGTIHVPKTEETASPIIAVIDYDASTLEAAQKTQITDCALLQKTKTVSWINIDRYNTDLMNQIQQHFNIHPLVLEDIVNTGQRPKIEDHQDYLFLVVKMIYFNAEKTDLISEQVSLIVGRHYVISFQEHPGDVFEGLRGRIHAAKGKIRSMGTDYLAYAIIDAIVDHYFSVLEVIGEKIDALEDDATKAVDASISKQIHTLKRFVIFLRKQMWPLRDVINGALRDHPSMITKKIFPYLRDLYDHCMQCNETIDAFKEALSSLHDIYLSSLSNRMNEIMKVLTIFAALFIPLTFLAGIYGMNFEYMPELKWRYGYFVTLGAMTGAIGLMIAYFKKKKWL